MKIKKKTVRKATSGEGLTAQLEELKRQNRILAKKLKRGGADVEAVAREAAAEARKAAMKDGSSITKKLQKQIAALEAENKKAKLKSIRARLMQKYSDRLIPSLLIGETKEELEAAAVRSHKAWKDAVRGVGHQVEDEEEEDTNAEEIDEDEEDSEVDNDEEEDEEDEDEEEDEEEELPRKKPKASQAPQKKNISRAIPPEMPSINGRGGGLHNKGGRNPRALLNSVKAWSPTEYRERRGEVKAALRMAYPKQT